MWTAVKVVLFACWSLVLGYFCASLVDRVLPGTFVAPDGFFAAVAGLAVGIFPGIWMAFASVGQSEVRESADGEPAAPGAIPCPTCHAAMRLIGTNGHPGASRLYLWSCEQGHGWARQGAHPLDPTFPWQACRAKEVAGVLFG